MRTCLICLPSRHSVPNLDGESVTTTSAPRTSERRLKLTFAAASAPLQFHKRCRFNHFSMTLLTHGRSSSSFSSRHRRCWPITLDSAMQRYFRIGVGSTSRCARGTCRAHRAQPQGPRAGRGRRREPYEGRARARRRTAQSTRWWCFPALIDGEGPILFESLAIIRISQRAASEPAAAAAQRQGLRGCEGVCTNPRKEIAFTECGGGRNRIVALKTSTN